MPTPGVRPDKQTNNIWYTQGTSPSTLVFVHGIFSNSRSCWFAETNTGGVYWLDLINQDARLHGASIFLGGFYTDFDAGRYDISDCANELLGGITTPDPALRRTVLEHERIVFICHSTGGIIVRYLLTAFPDLFANKEVGLLLMASPSMGSKLADLLGGPAKFYNNQLGLHLKWGNDLLEDLDTRFKNLLDRKSIPKIAGIEGCENHFVIHRKWLPDRTYVVEKESAGRYFTVHLLRDTDHFSTVKPHNESHPAHQLLVRFWLRHYGPPLSHDVSSLLDASKAAMRDRNLRYFSPAMLFALLYPEGLLASAMNALSRGSAAKLRNEVEAYLQQELPSIGPDRFVDFDWYARQEIRTAQARAAREGESAVSEGRIVQALLESPSKSMSKIRKNLGVDFTRLMAEIEGRCDNRAATPMYKGLFGSSVDE